MKYYINTEANRLMHILACVGYFLAMDESTSGGFGLRVMGSGILEKSEQVIWRGENDLGHYAIVFVLEGRGFFESKQTGRVDVQAGSSIILMPGVAHGYGPDGTRKWLEHWMIFDGSLPEMYRKSGLITPEGSVIDCSENSELLGSLWSELDRLNSPNARYAGSQSSALGVSILSLTVANSRSPMSPRNDQYRVVIDIIEEMQAHVQDESFDIESAVQCTPYSYTHIRRLFKQYTGHPPIQYYNILKTRAAKRVLMTTDESANSIGRALGIEDPAYFRRMFKRIEGMTPQGYRNLMRDWIESGSSGE
jgi:AraC-like DNA-binding protein